MFKNITAREVRDLVISFLVLSLAFSILFANRDFSFVLQLLPIVMVGVGSSFIFHELAHKFVALHYGHWAEFEMWIGGILLALFSSFIGIIIAAPGAVYIDGYNISEKENGIISIAGAVVNIILALIFLVIGQFFISGTILNVTCMLGFYINSYLAAFNLIPFGPLDGAKVIQWSVPAWLITIFVAGVLTYCAFTGMFF